ncbi:PREDICTED: mitogen-activated protein kinase 15 [Myotis davidii]|uniref:mitogen-activated protein kinase 15 n=1 Tax=Myotis davidii TaxID=225400 RepID=UPI0003EC48C6|nr:PREDICTED: mitogen-activated protein kinase 15 [Myotis davidii]
MLLQEFGDHPNIIRLLDVIQAENDRDIYLVFEFMDTDLNAVICKGTLLKDVHKRYIFYQLLRAAKFIHSGRVIHRDQKVPPRLAHYLLALGSGYGASVLQHLAAGEKMGPKQAGRRQMDRQEVSLQRPQMEMGGPEEVGGPERGRGSQETAEAA